MNKDTHTSFTKNYGASPSLRPGFPGNCHVAPVTLCVIGAMSFLPAIFVFSRTEALLMARNTVYLNVYMIASVTSCIHASMLSRKRLAILVPGPGNMIGCFTLILREIVLGIDFLLVLRPHRRVTSC
jgi:hypothetical protein